VVSRRTQPDTRTGRVNPQASVSSTAVAPPQDPRPTQAPRGLHGSGTFDFIGQPQAPGVPQQRGPGSKLTPNILVVFPLNHYSAAVPAPVPGRRESALRSPPVAPRKTVKSFSPPKDGQFVFTGWNDEAKRELFAWKVKRKKGYAFFLHFFPGETVGSLHEAYKLYKDEGERLLNG